MTAPKTLSIRAPWWWAILYAGKDIENRDWSTNYRGRLFIHASTWWSLRQVIDLMDDITFMRLRMDAPPEKPAGWSYRDVRDLGGHVVGVVDMNENTPVETPVQVTRQRFEGTYSKAIIAYYRPSHELGWVAWRCAYTDQALRLTPTLWASLLEPPTDPNASEE